MRRFGQYSTVGFAVFALFVVAGVIATALTSHVSFVIAGILIGIYFLYAIKVVDQCLRTCMLPGLKKHTLLTNSDLQQLVVRWRRSERPPL